MKKNVLSAEKGMGEVANSLLLVEFGHKIRYLVV